MDNKMWGSGGETILDDEGPGAKLPILEVVPDPSPLEQHGQPVATVHEVQVVGPSAFDVIKSPRTVAMVAGGALGYWLGPKKTRVAWGLGGAAVVFAFFTYVLPRLGDSSAPPRY